MDDKRIDSFDDLFEPFDLEGKPDEAQQSQQARRTVPVRTDDLAPAPLPVASTETSGILCSTCGVLNHVGNRHCDSCGARLVRSQMPVAPQPMLRTTAGARALIVLAGVVLAVALLALIFNVFGGAETSVTSTTEPATQTTVGAVAELQPLRVECSSELAPYPCEALIDGNPETSWNATPPIIGTTITFLFQPPVQITEMWIQNLQDEGRFLRNARITSIEVELDDRPQLHIQNIADSQETQQVRLNSMRTSRVTVTIMGAAPGQSHEGQEPFDELAVQSIIFWGRVTPGE
jgi:hypothetical protein